MKCVCSKRIHVTSHISLAKTSHMPFLTSREKCTPAMSLEGGNPDYLVLMITTNTQALARLCSFKPQSLYPQNDHNHFVRISCKDQIEMLVTNNKAEWLHLTSNFYQLKSLVPSQVALCPSYRAVFGMASVQYENLFYLHT